MKLLPCLNRSMACKKLGKLLLAIMLCLTLPAIAQPEQNKEINKKEAAQKAKQMVKGRVLRVEQNKKKYRVKMLKKSGRVVSVDVDKKSGEVSETKKSEKEN